jgi:hypothetical protein
MVRLLQTLSIITVAVTFSLTYSEANLRATVADVDEVDVSLDIIEVRRLMTDTEDDDYAPVSGSKGMGKGGKGN